MDGEPAEVVAAHVVRRELPALDLRADDTRTFPIHRITAVTAVETRS